MNREEILTSVADRQNLRGVNLSEADLSEAYLSGANLRGANLSGANLDFASWPLWCGSFGVHVSEDTVKRLLYHVCRMDCPDANGIQSQIADYANTWEGVERHSLDKIT